MQDIIFNIMKKDIKVEDYSLPDADELIEEAEKYGADYVGDQLNETPEKLLDILINLHPNYIERTGTDTFKLNAEEIKKEAVKRKDELIELLQNTTPEKLLEPYERFKFSKKIYKDVTGTLINHIDLYSFSSLDRFILNVFNHNTEYRVVSAFIYYW